LLDKSKQQKTKKRFIKQNSIAKISGIYVYRMILDPSLHRKQQVYTLRNTLNTSKLAHAISYSMKQTKDLVE
jgi:hypothetical protein